MVLSPIADTSRHQGEPEMRSSRRSVAASAATILALAAAPLSFSQAHAGTTELISRNARGSVGNRLSEQATISADGQRVAFLSSSSNLGPRDTNGFWNVFVFDRRTNSINLVSVSTAGQQADGPSDTAIISGNGQFVVFQARASNLAPGGRYGGVFVRDLVHGTTTKVWTGRGSQRPSGGAILNAFSSTGRYILFDDLGDPPNVFLRDRKLGTTALVSVTVEGGLTDRQSYGEAVSDDGRYVLFASDTSTVVAGDMNGKRDVFLRDMVTRTTRLVSVGEGGVSANGNSGGVAVSNDGKTVWFESDASNLTAAGGGSGFYKRDMVTGTTTLVSLDDSGKPKTYPFLTVSGNGRFAAFLTSDSEVVPGDTNRSLDVFVRDMALGVTERVSVDKTGGQVQGGSDIVGRGALSYDGGVVAFTSHAPNLVPADPNPRPDVFVRVR